MTPKQVLKAAKEERQRLFEAIKSTVLGRLKSGHIIYGRKSGGFVAYYRCEKRNGELICIGEIPAFSPWHRASEKSILEASIGYEAQGDKFPNLRPLP